LHRPEINSQYITSSGLLYDTIVKILTIYFKARNITQLPAAEVCSGVDIKRGSTPTTAIEVAGVLANRKLAGQMLKTVRRGKAAVHSGRQTRPGTGSLHPVAIEATAEVTKPLEPSV
jgi:hypothetical protein